jgi:hypothetical protein
MAPSDGSAQAPSLPCVLAGCCASDAASGHCWGVSSSAESESSATSQAGGRIERANADGGVPAETDR